MSSTEEAIYDVLGLNAKDLYLYELQQKAPKPRMVPCRHAVIDKPEIYGNEYHGALTRAQATQILEYQPAGSYLVRASVQRPGEYSLSFMYGKPRHFLLYHNDTGFFVGEGAFDTVEELVADGLIALHMEEHKAEQYINIQNFKRRTCKKAHRQKHIASARRVLANHEALTTDNLDEVMDADERIYDSVVLVQDGGLRSQRSISEPSVVKRAKPPIPPRSSSLVPRSERSITVTTPDSSDKENDEPVYIAPISIHDVVDEEGVYSTVDNGHSTGTDSEDEELQYITPPEDNATPPPLPPITSRLEKKFQFTRRNSSPISYEKHHNFKLTTFRGPTWCDHCKHFLWGLKRQGFKCEDCGVGVHKLCMTEVDPDCQPNSKCVNGVYNVDLLTLVKLQGRKVPNIVRECIGEVELRGMENVGVYRVCGKNDEVCSIKESYNNNQDPKLSSFHDINAVTGALKLFLRELPTKLINGDCYTQLVDQFRSVCNTQEKLDPMLLEMIQYSLSTLSAVNYNVLRYIMKHLNKVANHEQLNKMTADNLAVVFAPTLMSSNDEFGFADICHQRKLVQALILHYNQIF